MLQIKNLSVTASDKTILHNFNININKGEIHILMGPNGAGKSTVCKSIMSHFLYKKTAGTIYYDKEDITSLDTSEIAKKGIYYINQTPVEIEGITNTEVLRSAMKEQNIKMDLFAFQKKCYEICEKLSLPKSFLHRFVNVGMSGGERKKNELLHMWILNPSLILLDEIDSGLDVDALKIVGKTLLEYQKEKNASILLITHQPSLIKMLNPKFVHVMRDGQIVKSGDITLGLDILEKGFSVISEANSVKESEKNE